MIISQPTIKYINKVHKKYHAYYRPDNHSIRIYTKNRSKHNIRATLIHELIHASKVINPNNRVISDPYLHYNKLKLLLSYEEEIITYLAEAMICNQYMIDSLIIVYVINQFKYYVQKIQKLIGRDITKNEFKQILIISKERIAIVNEYYKELIKSV